MKRLAITIIAIGLIVIAFAKIGGLVQAELAQSADRVVQFSEMNK